MTDEYLKKLHAESMTLAPATVEELRKLLRNYGSDEANSDFVRAFPYEPGHRPGYDYAEIPPAIMRKINARVHAVGSHVVELLGAQTKETLKLHMERIRNNAIVDEWGATDPTHAFMLRLLEAIERAVS